MRLAFYQPDIPQNVGAAVRLAACFDVGLEVIGPCGFPLGDRGLRRVAMDYAAAVEVVHHDGWNDFLACPARAEGRLLLMTTAGAIAYTDFAFAPGDTILLGRESAGAPASAHAAADVRLAIPLTPPARSLNVVVAAAMALGEALRQTRWRA